MPPTVEETPYERHDWHSPSYVEDWIARDEARNRGRPRATAA
jgi:hypothetical protein